MGHFFLVAWEGEGGDFSREDAKQREGFLEK